jgi:hypothetical protein
MSDKAKSHIFLTSFTLVMVIAVALILAMF